MFYLALPAFLLCVSIVFYGIAFALLRYKSLFQRTIRTTIYLDSRYLEDNPRITKKLEAMFDDATEIFRKNFGAAFAIQKIVPWETIVDKEDSAKALLSDLVAKVDPKNTDIVVGFTSQDLMLNSEVSVASPNVILKSKNRRLHGYAQTPERVSIVSLKLGRDRMRATLLHELGHLFGARHVTASYMLSCLASINRDELTNLSFDKRSVRKIKRNLKHCGATTFSSDTGNLLFNYLSLIQKLPS